MISTRAGYCDLALVDRQGPAAAAATAINALSEELPSLWLRRSRPGSGMRDTLARLAHTASILSASAAQVDGEQPAKDRATEQGGQVDSGWSGWWSWLLRWGGDATGAPVQKKGGREL